MNRAINAGRGSDLRVAVVIGLGLCLSANPAPAQDVKERMVLRGTAHADAVRAVAFPPDGKFLASAGNDKTVRLWDVATGKQLHTLKGHKQGVTGSVFTSDGKCLISGSLDGTLKVWDVATGAEQATLTGHAHGIYAIALSPDGSFLASASNDMTVRLWNIGIRITP